MVAAIGVSLSGCGGGSPLARLSPERTAHETYAESLREAGLDGAALGQEWLVAADAALGAAHAVTLPIRETGYFDPAEPAAVAYRFDLPRGRRLAVAVTLESTRPGRLFLDLFRASEERTERVASAASGAPDLDYVSDADGSYILRLQPELLRGGRYRVSLPDGPEGFIEARSVTGASAPLRVARLARDRPLRDHPSAAGIVIRHLEAGTRVPVLAEFTDFLLVEAAGGVRGWLSRDDS